jgi:sec-independent protein translocase protein TatB
MFDFSWSEILVIGMVALVVIGPKELPGVLRTLGQWMGKVRRMASEFQNQFQDAIREAELADIKKEVDNMAAATHFDPLDPLAEVRKDLENTQREVETALAGTPAAGARSSASSAPAGASGEVTPAASASSPPEAAPAEPAAAPESVPVAPADEPKVAAEHGGGNDRR